MSQENVEIVKTLLWDGVDAVRIVQDDAALASYLADIEPLLWPECVFAWNGPGGRFEARALDDMIRRVWLASSGRGRACASKSSGSRGGLRGRWIRGVGRAGSDVVV
jgi:hypothetical protein